MVVEILNTGHKIGDTFKMLAASGKATVLSKLKVESHEYDAGYLRVYDRFRKYGNAIKKFEAFSKDNKYNIDVLYIEDVGIKIWCHDRRGRGDFIWTHVSGNVEIEKESRRNSRLKYKRTDRLNMNDFFIIFSVLRYIKNFENNKEA